MKGTGSGPFQKDGGLMNPDVPVPVFNRREWFGRCGLGLGALALAGLAADEARPESGERSTLLPMAPRPPQFLPRAKRVIHVFANGGPSHVDTFDPKPL